MSQGKNKSRTVLETLALVSSLIVLVGALLVLVGWALHIEPLKRVLPSLVAMNPLTAVTFILAAVCLLLVRSARIEQLQPLPFVLAGLVFLIGLVKLLGMTPGLDSGLDRLLFADQLNAEPGGQPNTMAPNTALNFFLVGAALGVLSLKRPLLWTAQVLSVLVLLFAGFVLAGYFFGAYEFLAPSPFIPMALHTAFLFVVVGLAVLLHTHQVGLMSILVSDSMSGVLARRLVPAAIFVPIFLGWLRLEGERRGIYSSAFGATLYALAAVLIFGGILWLVLTSLEKTDRARRQAEQSVRDERNLLQALMDNIPDTIYYKDRASRFTRINKAQARVLRVALPQDAVGKTDFDFQWQDISSASYEAEQALMATGEPLIDFVEFNPTAEGHDRWFSSTKVALYDDHQEIIGLVGISRDITRLKQTEAALRASEEQLRTVLESAPVIFWSADRDGVITMLQGRGLAEIGLAPNALVGSSIMERIAPRAELQDYFWSALGGQDVAVMVESGNRIFDSRYSPLRSEDGEIKGVIGLAMDVTERVRAEREVQQLNASLQRYAAQLEAANKELEAFSYSVSHDLRAPLRSIDGFSQALLDDYGDRLDADGHDYLTRVRLATRRMGDLIDGLLSLSRVTRGELRREQVDLSALARTIAADLNAAPGAREVEFVIAEGMMVKADSRLLRVALENLLRNAWKFSSKQPHVRIEFGHTTAQERSVYFVRDNGVGFDSRYADKLFGAFQRLHAVTEFPGTGIGLATVQRIIHRHGGQIWAESQLNCGATFYFELNNSG